MSFAKTKKQIEAGTKTETRRMGWNCLNAGDILQAVDKTMGFRKGQKAVLFCNIRVEKTWREPLNVITQPGCDAEGFPEFAPDEFVSMFCEMNKCVPDTEIRVIQFSYLEG
jgi:hypothetical protein